MYIGLPLNYWGMYDQINYFLCILTTIGGGKGGGARGLKPPPPPPPPRSAEVISHRNYLSWSGAENRDKNRDTLIEQSR